jgi:hypothetical protein
MADLIAIGYPDETTAEVAAGQARRLAHNLIIQPGAIAVIVRDERGSYPVHTSHYSVGTEAAPGTFVRARRLYASGGRDASSISLVTARPTETSITPWKRRWPQKGGSRADL